MVAPVPIRVLVVVVLMVILAIFAALLFEVTTIGMVFVFIPVVVIVMPAIVDAYVYLLSVGCANHHGRCSDSGGQHE